VPDAVPGMTSPEPFEAFVREYQDMVFATAVRLLGNAAEAEDIAQSVFMRAYQRFDAIAASPAAAGWLKTVTRNACLNHLSRYRKRWRLFSELETTEGEGTPFDATLADTASPALALENADALARLEAAMRGLPDHQRVPLVLFHLEEMSYQDIAAALDISLAKVKSDIHRGREALRKTLSPDVAR